MCWLVYFFDEGTLHAPKPLNHNAPTGTEEGFAVMQNTL